MCMTSVSGHLLNHEFLGSHRKWTGCPPEALFDATVVKECSEDFIKIKVSSLVELRFYFWAFLLIVLFIQATLEREVRTSDKLIIWTDCDREGENIGFEIITVCQRIKPNIEVLR